MTLVTVGDAWELKMPPCSGGLSLRASVAES